ncbi:uncharacterized protein C8orf74 homolog [Triplophysa dalaica]|uniref:uncharacterized protein C8orf74 homolog n=1 Tax=Triplophysa dalaica TaxID=1582913 RepID=UPI0024DF79B0|nr:uncharacterized protein C8orf74 homolog [Triplophysa dalaica]
MASTDATIQEIWRMKRDAGLRRLSGCFHWTDFDGDDKRLRSHQEFVYENVMHALKRGLPCSSVGQLARVTKDLLPRLVGLKTSDAVGVIRDQLSQIQPRLSSGHHAVLVDFILKTYVPHQRLYQAFLNGDTGLRHIRSELEVEGPPHSTPLCEGTDAVELEHQQVLEETRSKKEEDIMKLKVKTEAQMMAKLQACLNDLPREGNVCRLEVEKLLHNFLQSQGQIMMKSLMEEASLTDSLLNLKLRQKSQLTERHLTDDPVSTKQHCVPTSTKKKFV